MRWRSSRDRFEEGKFVALFGRAGRLRAVMAIGKLMGFRPLLEAGSSWDDALAHRRRPRRVWLQPAGLAAGDDALFDAAPTLCWRPSTAGSSTANDQASARAASSRFRSEQAVDPRGFRVDTVHSACEIGPSGAP
jgi:hypothetical protein